MNTTPVLIDVARQRQQDARIETIHQQLRQLAHDLRGDPRELEAWRIAVAFKGLRRAEIVAELDRSNFERASV